jgi:hypothetical protein
MDWTNRGIIRACASTAIPLLALLLASPTSVFGYVDPGSGSFIYQVVYAAFLGGMFSLRKFLNRIFNKRDKPTGSQPK